MWPSTITVRRARCQKWIDVPAHLVSPIPLFLSFLSGLQRSDNYHPHVSGGKKSRKG